MTQFDLHFSGGLVQPPTSIELIYPELGGVYNQRCYDMQKTIIKLITILPSGELTLLPFER